MKRLDIPANITLLELTNAKVAALKPVRVLDIMEGATQNFHEDGLFSVSIFGRVGSDERDARFSYVDLRTTVIHPLIYKHLIKLRGLYGGILSGKAYAKWNTADHDFEPSDEVNGDTGYAFFIKHWRDIVHKPTGSEQRDVRIQLIEKYKAIAMTNKVLIIPAGLRDFTIDAIGRMKEGEINNDYRSLISVSNAIGNSTDLESPILDNSRFSMQLSFNRVYDFLDGMVQGKGGFIQQKWGGRRIFNGTRNVISSMDLSPPHLGARNAPTVNHTTMGLFQCIKGALPLAKHYLTNSILSKAFNTNDGVVRLVNRSTLQAESARVPTTVTDRWASSAGLETVINSYREPALRLRPIIIEDYYLGLVYRPKERKVFKIFNDIRDLPSWANKEDVYPLTLCELIYLSGYKEWNKLVGFGTRYPITGIGSIYPSTVYVKNTVVGEVRRELDENWYEYKEDAYDALEYPTFTNPSFVDTMIPSASRLDGLGADKKIDVRCSRKTV